MTWFRVRVAVTYLAFLGFFALVALRLVQLQVLPNSDLQSLARRQSVKKAARTGLRGAILDRNGEELAVSVPAGSVFVRPSQVRKPRETARKLARILGGSPESYLSKIKSKKSFIWLQRQASVELSEKIAAAKIPGVFVEQGNKRVYPSEHLAANLLGFTDIDGNGIEGLELSLNEKLTDPPMGRLGLKDGRGNLTYLDSEARLRQEIPSPVQLTIDKRLQNAVEEELDRAQQSSGAAAVFAVIIDPRTGEVLAAGQRPTYNPNRAAHATNGNTINRIVSHLYEPGSVLKTLFAAEAIERQVMQPESLVDCGQGEVLIGKNRIREAEADHRYGKISLEKVLRWSSNVGAVRVAQQLGPEAVRRALERNEVFTRTGIELPGEVSWSAKPAADWSPLLTASVGFGQAVSMTPLRMVSLYAPFANGGFLVRPRILARTEGEELPRFQRVYSEETARKMREMLVGVTELEKGTGWRAKIQGVRVAGKTGTAQKYEQGMGYDSAKYFSSFIGFFPAENPELLMGVFVDEPGYPYYGSMVAAPVFARIGTRAMNLLGKGPQLMAQESGPPDPETEPRSIATVTAPRVERDEQGRAVMPDLKGLSLREIRRVLGLHAKDIRTEGSGYCQAQVPQAGVVLSPGTQVSLQFGT